MIKYDLFLVGIHTNENAFTLFCGGKSWILEYSIDTPCCEVMAFVCKGVKYIEVNGLLDRLHTYFIPVQNFQIEI